MDPFTHALSGALAGRALAPAPASPAGTARTALWTGLAAALAPDADYLLRLAADPLTYLNWHRTFTHSLLLLPLWAGLLTALLGPARRRLGSGRTGLIVATGTALHILLDLVTPFGTAVLWPLDGRRFSLSSTFVVDPLVTVPLLAGLVLAWRADRRGDGRGGAVAGVALLLAGGVLAAEQALHQRALALARAHAAALGLGPERAHAIPQPLSPLRWKLVVETPAGYAVAHVRLFARAGGVQAAGAAPPEGILDRVAAAYAPAARPPWRLVPHPARDGRARPLAARAWSRPELAAFRRFARFPFVVGETREGGMPCAWFSDLRFAVPGLAPPFRFGLCRGGDGTTWRLRHLPRRARGVHAPLTAD